MDDLLKQYEIASLQKNKILEVISDLEQSLINIKKLLNCEEHKLVIEKCKYEDALKNEKFIEKQINDEKERIEKIRQREIVQMTIEDEHMHEIIMNEKRIKHNEYIESIYPSDYLREILIDCIKKLNNKNNNRADYLGHFILSDMRTVGHKILDKLIEKKIIFVNFYSHTVKVPNVGPCNEHWRYEWMRSLLCVDIYGNYEFINVNNIMDSRLNYDHDPSINCHVELLCRVIDSAFTQMQLNKFIEPFNKNHNPHIFLGSVDLFNLFSGSCENLKLDNGSFSRMNYNCDCNILLKNVFNIKNSNNIRNIIDICIDPANEHSIEMLLFKLDPSFPYNVDKLLKFFEDFDIIDVNCYRDNDRPGANIYGVQVFCNFFDMCGNVYTINGYDNYKTDRYESTDLGFYDPLYSCKRGSNTEKILGKELIHLIKNYKTKEQYEKLIDDMQKKLLTRQFEDQFESSKQELLKKLNNFIFDKMEQNDKFNRLYEYIAHQVMDKNKKILIDNIVTTIVDEKKSKYSLIYKYQYGSESLNNYNLYYYFKKFFKLDVELYEEWLCKYARNFALGIKDPKYIFRL